VPNRCNLEPFKPETPKRALYLVVALGRLTLQVVCLSLAHFRLPVRILRIPFPADTPEPRQAWRAAVPNNPFAGSEAGRHARTPAGLAGAVSAPSTFNKEAGGQRVLPATDSLQRPNLRPDPLLSILGTVERAIAAARFQFFRCGAQATRLTNRRLQGSKLQFTADRSAGIPLALDSFGACSVLLPQD